MQTESTKKKSAEKCFVFHLIYFLDQEQQGLTDYFYYVIL